jgi:hypothetical protein
LIKWFNMRPSRAIRNCGEYWIGRMRVVWILNSELQVVAPTYVD